MDTAPVWTVRPALPSDTDTVVALVQAAYRGDSSRAGWTTEADLLAGQRTDPAEVATAIADRAGVLLLAVGAAGDVLGCARLERRASYGYFGMFAVDPARQGDGVGRRLLAEAERRVHAEWGLSSLEMSVIRQREDLIGWYERRGYRRTGATAPFPYGDERFGVPLRDDLEFVVLVKDLPG